MASGTKTISKTTIAITPDQAWFSAYAEQPGVPMTIFSEPVQLVRGDDAHHPRRPFEAALSLGRVYRDRLLWPRCRYSVLSQVCPPRQSAAGVGLPLLRSGQQLLSIVNDIAPGLAGRYGVGPVTAAQAIVSFSHPGRCRSEAALGGTSPIPASSGQTVPYRLNRGGAP